MENLIKLYNGEKIHSEKDRLVLEKIYLLGLKIRDLSCEPNQERRVIVQKEIDALNQEIQLIAA